MRSDYNVTITDCTRELSVKEKIMLKDFSNAVPLDKATSDTESPLVVEVDYFALMTVHNEHSRQDKEYEKIVVVDTAGTKFVTGSKSFYNALTDIYGELTDTGENGPFTVEIFSRPSANYTGKSFITCSLV